MQKRIKRLAILMVLLTLAAIVFLYINKTLSGRILTFGVKMNTSGFKLTDSYREINGTNKVYWLVADSQGNKLFLGRLLPEDPAKYINDKVFLLTALFEPTQSPYPEVITNVIDCPQEFKPVKQDFGSGVIYKLYAGERYGYGICTKDLIKYNAYYGLFDCGKKGVFEIKLFGSPGGDEIQKIIESFSCK